MISCISEVQISVKFNRLGMLVASGDVCCAVKSGLEMIL